MSVSTVTNRGIDITHSMSVEALKSSSSVAKKHRTLPAAMVALSRRRQGLTVRRLRLRQRVAVHDLDPNLVLGNDVLAKGLGMLEVSTALETVALAVFDADHLLDLLFVPQHVVDSLIHNRRPTS